jgi:hypothetical protein
MLLLALQTVVLLALCPLARSFAIYNNETLDFTLGEGCISSLIANIDCIGYVQTFMTPRYRGTLNNVTLTDEICSGECLGSLKNWFDSVSKNCAGKTLEDTVPMKFGG